MERVTFPGALGATLAGRLDTPAEQPGKPPVGRALLAHCFTCGKDIAAASRIARSLNSKGWAVLRFDFTGLGHSEGEFASTNFSSNTQDLVAAAEWMAGRDLAPDVLIGHSLGGAAVLAAADQIDSCRAVCTIGAPADPAHVEHLLGPGTSEIEAKGEACLTLAGREFTIRKQFLDDIRGQPQRDRIAALRKPLLVMHSPRDTTVGIENAAAIFEAAKHPKSFVSLDGADHLLTSADDAAFAADIIAAWARRYARA